MAKKLIKRQALDEFAKLYVKTLKEQLENNKPFAKRATGTLINSIKVNISEEEGKDIIQLDSESYLKFVDKGVSGTIRKYNTPYSYRVKKPPIEAIRNWVRLKGLPDEATYPIRMKIFRFGLKPTNVLDKTIRQIEYKSKWVNKFEEEIVNEILDMAKETFGK